MNSSIFTFDEPYNYNGIKIYPVRLRDLYSFLYGVECLLVDKNSMPDTKIISMTYLDFLFSYNNDENKYLEKLGTLLYVVTKINPSDIKIILENKTYKLDVDGIIINHEDFEEIKNIIFLQNEVEVPDYTIQKEIRDKIDEGRRIRNKGLKYADLEEQMISLFVATGIPLEVIYDMTYRKFTKALSRMDLLMNYKILTSASMSGFVTFKSDIKHWLSKIEKENNAFLDSGDLKKKIAFEDKKK